MVNFDRMALFEQRAQDAQRAAACNDSKATYAIIRSLSNAASTPFDLPVLTKEGLTTKSEDERQMRWMEHFKDVFNGRLVGLSDMVCPKVEEPVRFPILDESPQASKKSIGSLGTNKDTGRGDIPAELLQAGEDALTVTASDAYTRVAEYERWPLC